MAVMGEHPRPRFLPWAVQSSTEAASSMPLSMRSLAFTLMVLAVTSGPALAGMRSIPPEAPATVMRMNGDGTVVLGKKTLSLSPAAQIRDTDNRIVLPASLGGPYRVRVLLNAEGQLQRAWILTDEEAAQPAPKF